MYVNAILSAVSFKNAAFLTCILETKDRSNKVWEASIRML